MKRHNNKGSYHIFAKVLSVLLVLCLTVGCGAPAESIQPTSIENGTEVQGGQEERDAFVSAPGAEESAALDPTDAKDLLSEAFLDKADLDIVEIEDEAVALASSPAAVPSDFACTAPGILEERNPKAVIDYSNTSDGYIMVQYTADTAKKLKVLVQGPTTQYQYNLTPEEWESLPLSDGNGSYQVGLYENVKGNSYSKVIAVTIEAELSDEFAPFLRSNQYVDFEDAPKTVRKAATLCKKCKDPLDKVKAVYTFVVGNLKYDKKLAASVKSGYLPDLDSVLKKKKGICFDYAALMTGMLRSQGVPCKLVIGYAGTAYHAWINVWSEEEGWINNAIYFDGTAWQRMDPTFASSGKQSKSIMKYIGDGENYSAKYFY